MFPCRPSQKNWNFSLPRWITKGWNWSIHFRLKVVCMEVSLCGTGQYLTFETFKMHMNTSHIYHIWMFTKEVATVLPCCLHMSPYFTAEWREIGIQAAPSCPRSEVVCCRWSTGSRGIRTGRCFWTLVEPIPRNIQQFSVKDVAVFNGLQFSSRPSLHHIFDTHSQYHILALYC